MPEPSKTQRQPLSFTATDWKDDKAGGTPITAAQLNRVEKGIADAVRGVNDANRRVLTFLVQSDGEHATQDINGAAITAPCQIYSIDEKKTWVDDGSGARIAPFATVEEMKTVRDSLSRIKVDTRVELKWVDPGKDLYHEAGLWAIIDAASWKLLARNQHSLFRKLGVDGTGNSASIGYNEYNNSLAIMFYCRLTAKSGKTFDQIILNCNGDKVWCVGRNAATEQYEPSR